MQLMAENGLESYPRVSLARMRLAQECNSSRRDLVKSKQSLRKVQIDVEGSMGPYY